jgi:HSP20 family protein
MSRTLVPWGLATPRLFDDLRSEMNDVMERFFAPTMAGADLGTMRGFVPRFNLAESDKEYDISVDLPGMKPEDFNVEIRDGNLWISGERKCEWKEEDQGKNYRRIGCQYGRFEEVVPLEVPVKADQVQANYKDGVLHLTVPKDESVQPKKIEVKSA